MGKLVAEHIPIENLNKQKGWFRLLFDEKISIPAEGFFIEIKQQTISSEPTYIGMIEINNATVDSYWIQTGLNQQITLLDANKHYGVKIHFIFR